MDQSNYKKFTEIMFILADLYNSSQPISEMKLDIYFNIFKEYPIDVFNQAVNSIIKTRTVNNFPKPAEIILEIEGSSADKSLTAWLQVTETIARVGAYKSVQFDDPVIHTVISEMGGWPKVCEVLEDDLKWMQKDFERLYQLCKTWPTKITRLVGLVEQQNSASDYNRFNSPVVQIGNTRRVKQIEAKNG